MIAFVFLKYATACKKRDALLIGGGSRITSVWFVAKMRYTHATIARHFSAGWDGARRAKSRKGRKDRFCRPLRDFVHPAPQPSDESPGYSQRRFLNKPDRQESNPTRTAAMMVSKRARAIRNPRQRA